MAEIGTCEFTIVETTVSDKLGGLLIPVAAKKVYATGTTATAIIAFY